MSPDSARYAQDRGQEPSTSPKAQSKAGAAGAPPGSRGGICRSTMWTPGRVCPPHPRDGVRVTREPQEPENPVVGSQPCPAGCRSRPPPLMLPSPTGAAPGRLHCCPPPPGVPTAGGLGRLHCCPHPWGFRRQVGRGGSTAAPTPGGSDGRWAGVQLPSVTQDEAQRRCNLPTRRLQRRRYDTLTRKPKEHCF